MDRRIFICCTILIIFILILYLFFPSVYLRRHLICGYENYYGDDKKNFFSDISRRTDSLPFVSGDTFRVFADYVFDQIETTIPSDLNVKENAIIFVKTDYIQEFFRDYFPQFKKKIILITHNSDYAIEEKYKNYLKSNMLRAWFAQNPYFEHPKLIPIPIGFNNAHHSKSHNEILINTQKTKLKLWNKRNILLYLNFSPETNVNARQKYLKLFEKIKGVKIVKNRIDFSSFLKDLANSKFVLCPRGTGLDTHRFYEAVLMGAIPIVEKSALDPIHKLGTVLVLPSFLNLTQQMLNYPHLYIKNMNFSKDIVFMETWLKKIYSFR